MDAQATQGLLRFFQNIDDTRAPNASHALADILAIAIMAVLCGAEGWAAVEVWGCANLPWLKMFLELRHGIPSHDTFDRVFGLLDPLEFEKCFQQWTSRLIENGQGIFVAVDGKTSRHAYRRCWSKTPVHLVSAFVSRNHLVLGQLATDSKSNEITAIPKLLALLDLAGTTVTIDAMGCQRDIAAVIRAQNAHYILAVKDNQPTLHEKVKKVMDDVILDAAWKKTDGYFEKTEEGHGRIETRRVWVSNEVKWLGGDLLEAWPGLASMVVVELQRQDLGDLSGHVSRERRYFISDHDHTNAAFFAEGIRQHWGIENGLHWCLDVGMNEDQSRLRVAHGAENFSRLRRIAINKLNRCPVTKPNGKVLKVGLRIKQQLCGWDRNFLGRALLA